MDKFTFCVKYVEKLDWCVILKAVDIFIQESSFRVFFIIIIFYTCFFLLTFLLGFYEGVFDKSQRL